jgi:hypothetical protein
LLKGNLRRIKETSEIGNVPEIFQKLLDFPVLKAFYGLGC